MQTAIKNRQKRKWTLNLFFSLLILILITVGGALWATDNYLWRIPAPSDQNPRAVIVDELAQDYPDPSFVDNATQSLSSSGYAVDYIGPGPNAVDAFRQLPGDGYKVVIIRAHIASSQSIITTQPYSTSQYQVDQLAGRVIAAQVESGPLYFALTPSFVSRNMQGRFPDSIVIVMGCSASQGPQDLATAFLDKGASVFVGWNGPVTVIHTDMTTVQLIRSISAGHTVDQATQTAAQPDPIYGAELKTLDWNTLVQGRVSMLIQSAAIWGTLGAMLILGPLSVFIIPKLSGAIRKPRKPKWMATRRRERTTSFRQVEIERVST